MSPGKYLAIDATMKTLLALLFGFFLWFAKGFVADVEADNSKQQIHLDENSTRITKLEVLVMTKWEEIARRLESIERKVK